MITLQAVVEVPGFDADSTPPWPVEPMAAGSWLTLDAHCTERQVGLFVATLAHPYGVTPPAGPGEVADVLLAEETLVLPGGLRLADTTTGVGVVPGCCAGLEDWRDWTRVATGGSPWLGHDPGPEVEVVGDDVRVWQNGGPGRDHGLWAGVNVVVPRLALPGLLTDVRRDLLGFLTALGRWTTRVGLADHGRSLVEAVDRNFAIRAPLDLPAD